MKKLDEIFHPGELAVQEKYNDEQWSDFHVHGFNRMFREDFDEWMKSFVEKQTLFFIATANSQGECDCNFRGTETDENGNLLQAVKIATPNTLIFPDYPGNNIYSSIGNLKQNANIGMIFINFDKEIRIRVNGSTKVIEENEEWQALWPKALRFVQVSVKQVFYNCPQRIKQSAQGSLEPKK